MIQDIIHNSIGKNEICMSDEVHQAMMELRKFMFGSLYQNPLAKSEEAKADKLITELYGYYMDNIEALPDNYRRFITECGETPERVVCDYIAGMSDQIRLPNLKKYLFRHRGKYKRKDESGW